MKPIPSASLIENLGWRYATKKFDASKKIAAEHWTTLEQSLVLSPSSFGLQPWKFYVITDPTPRSAPRSNPRRGISRRLPTRRTWSSSLAGPR